MANAAGMINEGLWRKDKDFQRLPRLAQCTFCQVLSQKDLDCAGVLTVHLDLFAKACDELTVDQLRTDFTALEAAGFVFIDYDTDELLIRSYLRLVSVKSPNAWKSAIKAAKLVASPKLKTVLAAELRRVGRKDASDLADEIDPVGTPSEPPPDGVGNPSGRDIPSEPHSEPPSSVPVVGQVTYVGNHLGEGAPPPRYCPKHPNGTDGGCWACKQRRLAFEAWEAGQAAAGTAAAAAAAEARRNCRVCEGTNWIPNTEPAVKCFHVAQVDAEHA